MNLQADETLWMCFVDGFVGQVGNCITVDPSLDVRTFGNDAELVPFAVLHVFVRNQIIFRSQPTTTSRLAVDVTRFGTFLAACFNFTLRSIDATNGVIFLFPGGLLFCL